MTTGHVVSMASVPAVMQWGSLEPTVPVAVITDAVQQNDEDFAGLLSGIQLAAKDKDPPGFPQVDRVLDGDDGDHMLLDAGTERQVTDLMTQFRVLAGITTQSESESNSEDPEKVEIRSDAVPLGRKSSDVTSQMALAAYSQSGRMPDVNTPTPLPIDMLQNVAAITEHHAVTATSGDKVQREQTVAEPKQESSQESVVTGAEQTVVPPATGQDQHNQPDTVRTTAFDRQPVLVEMSVATPLLQQVSSDRMSDVNILTQFSVDRQQNVAIVIEQPAVIATPSVKTHIVQPVAELVQEAPSLKPAVTLVEKPVARPAAVQDRHHQPETVRSMAVDRRPVTTVAVEEVRFQPMSHATPADVVVQEVRLVQPAPATEAFMPVQPVPVEESVTATPLQQVSSDRMSDVNKPTQLPVDKPQNVATEKDPHAAIAAPTIKIDAEQAAADLSDGAPSLNPAVTLIGKEVAHPAADQDRHHESESARFTIVGRQPVSTVSAETAPTRVEKPDSRVEVITPVQLTHTEEAVAATSTQQVSSDSMSGVNKPTQIPVDRLQNVVTVAENTDDVQIQAIQARSPVTLSAIMATVPTRDELIVPQAEPLAIKGEKLTETSITLPSERSAAYTATPEPALSAESELEIRISQPRPITAQLTAVSVSLDNSSTTPGQEIRAARQRPNPELQFDKVRTGVEQSVVKEMAPLLQSSVPAGESALDSSTSGGVSDQRQPDDASDNQIQTQDMRGQPGAEHKKVSAVTYKSVPTEPARQDIPGQVMQQVKERLVQHDIKAGNQQITLTLSPDSLGELKINLNLQGQKLSVEIATENRTVRDAILQHTDTLKESLARQNITMESFDVTTGGKGSGSQGQNQNAWRELARQQQQQIWTSPRVYQAAQADLPSGQEVSQRQHGHTMLDIHY